MSELRQDIVTDEWIIMAPERMKRPHNTEGKIEKRAVAPLYACPFEDLEKSGNWPPIIIYPNEKKWEIAVIPNKYPALVHDPLCVEIGKRGIYNTAPGIGHHDIVVTRDHRKRFFDLSPKAAARVLRIFQERYEMMKGDKCLVYASGIHNWGPSAGASIYHPHYQIFTLPIIPSHIAKSLEGSKKYFERHERCAHCDIIRFEHEEKERIIDENSGAVVLATFTAKRPYEIRVFPKHHISFFEKTPADILTDCAKMLASALRRINKYLYDPDLNFYIHTAPLKNQYRYPHYHWHIEVRPHIGYRGGFEFGTGVDINAVGPENAAKILRGES